MRFTLLKIVLLVVALAAAHAAPQSSPNDVQVLKYDSDIGDPAGYKFELELSDGTKRSEQGTVVKAGTDDESISVQGSYSFVAPDGTVFTVTYTADDNGFQPVERAGKSK